MAALLQVLASALQPAAVPEAAFYYRSLCDEPARIRVEPCECVSRSLSRRALQHQLLILCSVSLRDSPHSFAKQPVDTGSALQSLMDSARRDLWGAIRAKQRQKVARARTELSECFSV
uniref:Uncharacterized protein n=1 Tax=Tetraselmis sp. GSL018 TaxID=582737 RepID=A0A061RRR9_9CHLO